MRTTKSLLLGAAAGLVVVSGAQAADLPVKAKAVEYVKVCSAYGAGFYYIPGTDICLRVGGAVRADYYHNAPGAFPDITSGNTRSEETHGFRGRGYVILDARQNTAYGTLRAYLNIYQSWTTSSAGLGAAEGTNADRAFIQFAGFTFGRAQSFYDFYASTGPHANLVSWNGQGTGATGWNVLAYTAQLGNGLSFSLSMEDQRRKAVINGNTATSVTVTPTGPATNTTATATTFGAPIFGAASVRAGQQLPALVANLRVDQAWGSAQIMGAVQELRATEPFNGSDTWGYAVGGGFTWNNPSAPGSQFGIQASYGKGALGYVASSYSGHNVTSGSAGSTGFLADGVLIGTTMHKTTAWGINAGYQHRFNPNWAWTIHGGYTSVSYNSTVDTLCGNTAGTGAGVVVGPGDCDFDFWSLGTRLLWTPVAGLDMGLDLMYHDMGSQTGANAMGAVSGAGTTTSLGDRDVWAAMFRVQRNF